ncbi:MULTISPECIES: hypothetical protein [Pontibacillus]|uniref:Lipoprotein n=1 Tax=Pontibacillus chungwhensis TaxID=265426 RepID=A0ABY8V3B3_9BACI|nr:MULTISPECIES: hypothetical protein [Pontibacillus]MCD5324622.1 hypothetical protein [Pontibacillus sp. HN14]WIF99084.1 hypothetical protein QNI29_05360 [Pontibacillus chungwhensis]
MKSRYILSTLILGTMIISGCNDKEQTETDSTNSEVTQSDSEEQDQGDTNPEQSSSTNENKEEKSSDAEKDTNTSEGADESTQKQSSDQASPSSLPENVKMKEFETKEAASAYIDGYQKVTQTNLDLGHDIEALQDAGAGHQYLSWNEGNWWIGLDYPTDSTYAVEQNSDEKELAKKIVTYLDTHYLPAPKEIGAIQVNGFRDSSQTKIQWQNENVVYEITSNKNNPLETIEMAVDAGKTIRGE